jgi:hypothetical protein
MCIYKCMLNVYKNQQNRQTGSRNLTGPKTLPTIWDTYMKLVTKYQIPVINSCWKKCDEKWDRYPILWEAFLDPSDSYFLFADFVGFYTHWTYMRGYHKWALAHSPSCFARILFLRAHWRSSLRCDRCDKKMWNISMIVSGARTKSIIIKERFFFWLIITWLRCLIKTFGIWSHHSHLEGLSFRVRVVVFNATFNNISVISWRPV